MMNRLALCPAALMLLSATAPAVAQWVNPDTCSHSSVSCQQAKKEKGDNDAASAEQARKDRAEWEREREQQRRTLLKAPAPRRRRASQCGRVRPTFQSRKGRQRVD
jgi:hypothetical protein